MRSLTRVLLFQCVCFFKVERRIDLVYGGGSVGLMGLVSQAVHDGGRHVLGFALSPSLSWSFKRQASFHPIFLFLIWFYKMGFHFFFSFSWNHAQVFNFLRSLFSYHSKADIMGSNAGSWWKGDLCIFFFSSFRENTPFWRIWAYVSNTWKACLSAIQKNLKVCLY